MPTEAIHLAADVLIGRVIALRVSTFVRDKRQKTAAIESDR